MVRHKADVSDGDFEIFATYHGTSDGRYVGGLRVIRKSDRKILFPFEGAPQIGPYATPAQAREAAALIARQPVIVELSYGIHGNEVSPPEAAMAPVERPWNAPSKVRISLRSSPCSDQYLRAILIASSAASVPELMTKTVSAKAWPSRMATGVSAGRPVTSPTA
mgnify:CR=1 FL=1